MTQRNFCSKLYKKEKKKDYNKLNMNIITDNGQFLRTIKSSLSGKLSAQIQISLVEKGKVLSKETKIALIFSNVAKYSVTLA